MASPPEFRGAASRLAVRVTSSRFAALVARAVLVAAGVGLLAIIGYAAGPKALASATPTVDGTAAEVAHATGSRPAVSSPASPSSAAPALANAPLTAPHPEAAPAAANHAARGSASPDDPVVLNTATVDEFRRLPGIGEKRAAAMIALRERLGRFRAVEDLLKVKGIGRAMLKRIRPLVRLDPRLDAKAAPDGGI